MLNVLHGAGDKDNNIKAINIIMPIAITSLRPIQLYARCERDGIENR